MEIYRRLGRKKVELQKAFVYVIAELEMRTTEKISKRRKKKTD